MVFNRAVRPARAPNLGSKASPVLACWGECRLLQELK